MSPASRLRSTKLASIALPCVSRKQESLQPEDISLRSGFALTSSGRYSDRISCRRIYALLLNVAYANRGSRSTSLDLAQPKTARKQELLNGYVVGGSRHMVLF